MAIKIDDRSLNSAVWMVHRQNAQTVQLSQQLADAIYVQLAATEGGIGKKQEGTQSGTTLCPYVMKNCTHGSEF